MKLTKEERHVIEHSLGWPKDYRNHFVTDASTDSWSTCRALVDRGLMVASIPNDDLGGMTVFVVTDAGRAALAKEPTT